MTPISYAGRVAIVTGSGRGIGRAHAIELAHYGAAVVVNDLNGPSADSVVTEILDSGGAAVASYADVSTEAGGAALVAEALERFGGVDVVINNAGARRGGLFNDLTVSDIDTVIDSHLRAAFFVTQPAWRVMCEKGYGRVIMTSSSAGLFASPGLSNYASAKAGLYGLTKALAYEGMAHGITVNAILPFASTPASAEHMNNAPELRGEQFKFVSAEELARVPPGFQDPMLSAYLVAYLASAQCAVTGEAFSVCNGRYARVFVGIADGWLAEDLDAVSPEAVGAHIDEIRDLTEFSVPQWIFDEVAAVVRRFAPS